MQLNKTNYKKAIEGLLLLMLFSVFFVLHIFNENFGLIPQQVAAFFFLYYVALTIIIFLLNLWVFKTVEKTIVFSFFCLCLFFFFGFFYSGVSRFFPGQFISTYSFLIPFILVIFMLFLFFIKKEMIRTRKLAFYIKWLLFAFVITEVLVLGYNLLTVQHSKNILLRSEEKNGTEQNGTCKKEKPDIFFIVFDEYTSTEGLAKYMNFDNKRIDSLFTANGFYLASGSRSNYNMTVFSLSSTLNYTYLDLKKTDNVISPKKILQGAETFKKNRLTSFLAGEGYEIINLGCLELENSVIHTIPFFDHMQGELINNQTFFSHLNRDIGWKFRIKNIFSGKPRIPSVHKEEKKRHISRNDFNEVQLINALNAEDDQPRFVYAHLMLPHDPFYFDSSGNLVSDTLILQGKLNREEAYISQLKYCNKILEKMIRSSVKKNNRERVVVIEGDHGFGYHDDPKKAEREFSNLNALYFSDLDYQGLYPTISPVNTFRLVLNKYFCFNLPLLTDSCFFMQQKK